MQLETGRKLLQDEKRKKWSRTWKMMKENRVLYLFLLPAALYLAVFAYWPMYGIQIAFRNFNFADGITGSAWAGFKWFRLFFRSPQFETVVTNTLSITFYNLFAGFPLPIMLALMMNSIQSKRFKRIAQTITYLPHFISVVVLVGMMSCMFSINSGWVNGVIRSLGGNPVHLMGEAKYFRHVYVWSDVWKEMGWGSIIYLAALTSIDPTLHEAAMIDGAGKLRRIWHVDIPGILPTVAIMLIMRLGSMMSLGFDKAYIMQNDMNIKVSEIVSTYVYKMGMLDFKYSYSSAIGLFNTVINFVLLTVVNQISGRLSGNSLW